MSDRRMPWALGLTLGLVLTCVFVGGFAVGTFVERSHSIVSDSTSDAGLKDFLSAYQLVTERSYFRPFDKHHLIQAAIDGMLSATGDPHTLFLSPQENQAANTQLNGSRFSGIGAIVVPYHNNLRVWVPLPHEPAAQAGVQQGDIVTAIDGQSVSTMTGERAIEKIHGRVGTTVRLTIVRPHHTSFTVQVKREQIPPVTAYGRMLPHHLADIQIVSFGDTTSHDVSDALQYVRAQGARGIILDLRGNPGGYVDAAQRVVSQFLSSGVVAYEETTDKRLHPLPVVSGERLTTLPVVVLVDAGTASAAEITAAALRDNGRALLLGTQTYGKGSMQSVYALTDGSSIRITDRLWLTPKKHSIQKVGIHPDIVVAPASTGADGSSDPQLAAAEAVLLKRIGL